MTGSQLFLSPEERECLIEILETDLKELRIEEHRTRAPKYREHLIHQEDAMNSVLSKLKGAVAEESKSSVFAGRV